MPWNVDEVSLNQGRGRQQCRMRAQANVESILHGIDEAIGGVLDNAEARIQLRESKLGERDWTTEANGAPWLGHPLPDDILCAFCLDERGDRALVELLADVGHGKSARRALDQTYPQGSLESQ